MKHYFSIAKEAELCNGYDDPARYALFKDNIEVTTKFVVTFFKKFPITLLDEQDFIMIGLEALWKSTEGFDPKINPNFFGSALRRIYGAILDELRNVDHLSRSDRQSLKIIEKEKQLLENKYPRTVTFHEASTSLGIGREKADRLKRVAYVDSLDSTVDLSDGEVPVASSIEDDTTPDPRLVADLNEVRRVLKEIDKKDQSMIYLYFFVGLTKVAIARKLGLNQVTVAQRLQSELDKVRKHFIQNNEYTLSS